VDGGMIEELVREKLCISTKHNILVHGIKENKMDKESLSSQMVMYTTVHGKMEKCMEKESTFLME